MLYYENCFYIFIWSIYGKLLGWFKNDLLLCEGFVIRCLG